MAFKIYTHIYYCEDIEISELMVNKTRGIDQVTTNNHNLGLVSWETEEEMGR